MVFHWSLGNSKSPQFSKTFINILADLKGAVVWMVSIYPLIFSSPSPLSNPLGTVPSAQISISITVNFLFHNFFSISLGSAETENPQYSRFSLVLLLISRPSIMTLIWWFICNSKSQTILCVSSSGIDYGLGIYNLVVWSNFNFLHNSCWVIFSTQSYLNLYSFSLVCCIDILCD